MSTSSPEGSSAAEATQGEVVGNAGARGSKRRRRAGSVEDAGCGRCGLAVCTHTKAKGRS
eukprot:7085603-Prorocentrum_lima.AAC.1